MRLYLKETSVSFFFLAKAKSGWLLLSMRIVTCDVIWKFGLIKMNILSWGGDGGGSGEFLTLDFKGEISKRVN